MEASPENTFEALRTRAARAARVRLATRFDLDVLEPESGYVEEWRLDVGLEVCRHILVKIPPQFPLVLPHVFLDRQDMFGVLSHVNRAGQFCYLEGEAVAFEVEAIADVVEEAVDIALKALSDPETLRADDEFRKEVFAYLPTSGSFLSLLDDYERPRLVSLAELKPQDRRPLFLVAEDEADGGRWLERTRFAEPGAWSKALFLPEATCGRPPFAETVRGVATHLRSSDPALFKLWKKELRRTTVCVTTVKSSLGITVLAWRHRASAHADAASAPKVRGFRGGRYPVETEIGSRFGDEPLKYFSGERIDLGRLANRTDPELLRAGMREAVIVGSGAVGSHLSQLLTKAALLSKVSVFDKDVLKVENVLRHASSFALVGHRKSIVALVQAEPHAPWTDYQARGDAIRELDAYQEACRTAGLVILATGSERLDRFLAEAAHPQVANGGAICQVWLEERAEVGRVLCHVKGNGGCPACGHRKRKTVDLNEGTVEPGCNASYANYGGSRLQRFCAVAADYILHATGSVEVEWKARTGGRCSVDSCGVAEIASKECERCQPNG